MPNSPIMAVLRRALREAASNDQYDPSRRNFLKAAGTLAVAPSIIGACTRPKDHPPHHRARVAVIGAGIAGLHTAWLLKRHGIIADVYEASARPGGRIFSAKDLLVQGAVTELGGEYIDSVHSDMLTLVKAFGLDLIDLHDEPYASRNETFFFDGRSYTPADIVREIRPLLERLRRDISLLPQNYRHLAESPARGFDAISIEAYFTSLGITGWLRSFLDVAFITENGLELGEQSALNFLSLISTDIGGGAFHQFGDSDERYKVRGGNQQITDRLAADIHTQIHSSHILERIGRKGSTYSLTFRKDLSSVDVDADIVVLTLPFTLLRTVKIDVDLPAVKRRAINELRYGQNGKVVVGYERPFWHDVNADGVIYTDLPLQLVWDNTAMQGVNAAGLTFFSGGSMCRVIGEMSKERAGRELHDHLCKVWPEARRMQPGRVERFHWPTYPWSLASYSGYGPGQWTDFYGREAEPANNLYFAGEHCSPEFRGYMNGAAQTGRLAATGIRAAMARATF